MTREFTITLTEPQLQVVLNHLVRGPYVEVAPVFERIQEQAAKQMEASDDSN